MFYTDSDRAGKGRQACKTILVNGVITWTFYCETSADLPCMSCDPPWEWEWACIWLLVPCEWEWSWAWPWEWPCDPPPWEWPCDPPPWEWPWPIHTSTVCSIIKLSKRQHIFFAISNTLLITDDINNTTQNDLFYNKLWLYTYAFTRLTSPSMVEHKDADQVNQEPGYRNYQ